MTVVHTADETNDGFQQLRKKGTDGGKGSVRLYLGGFPSFSSSLTPITDQDVRDWLHARWQTTTTATTEEEEEEEADGIFGAIEMNARKNGTFAYVEIHNRTITEVLRQLQHSKLGCTYDGKTITLQREQRNNKKNKNKSTAYNNKTTTAELIRKKTAAMKRGTKSGDVGRKGRRGKITLQAHHASPFASAHGWSQPTTTPTPTDDNEEDEETTLQEHQEQPVPTIEAVSERMATIVSNEMKQHASTKDEAINTALASTAATVMIASMLSGCELPLSTNTVEGEDKDLTTILPEPSSAARHATTTTAPGSDFSSFVKNQTTMTDLLADFGDADPHWKQKVIVEEDETGTPTACMAEIHTKSATTKSASTTTTSSSKTANEKSSSSSSSSKLSRLAIKGKAPIHVSLESFGYVHGAPSRQQREVSGSPYAQPLGILDMDQTILDPVPSYLDFHDGLKSGVVKRMLKAAPLVEELDANHENNTNSTNEKKTTTTYTHLNDYCKRYIVDTQIYPSLVEAITLGGHGWIHPVTMTYPIGSYLGRHRSVVAVELSAVHLRNALRHNTHPALAACTVSVGTVHRDIKKRIPQKTYKEDYDDDED